MRKIYFIFCFFIGLNAWAGTENLLPKPQHIKINSQRFYIDEVNVISSVWQNQWNDFLSEIGAKINPKSSKTIQVEFVSQLPNITLNPDEAYILEVKNKKITIKATHKKGVYWAIQTLRQLIVKGKKSYFEGCYIEDFPAFPIRGFMHDSGRTFIPLEELKTQISLLSRYKINVFHWHLTENQGWRIQSKRHPILNEPQNYERMPSEFYTLEQVKELTEFCKQHNVLLIPEIDMPGHSRAFTKAFGTDMQSEKGMQFLKELIDEFLEFADVPYLHIGTDEIEFTNPKFVPEMVEYIRKKGKKVISWNPGWTYKSDEIDMTQLWSYRGKVQNGIPAIDSRFHYINHFDAFGDIIGLYGSKILNVNHSSPNHAGVIVAIWNDRFIPDTKQILLQNHFYPSMLAISERAWQGGGSQYFDQYGTILPTADTKIFKDFIDFERRLLWHKKQNFNHLPFAYVKQTNVHWQITEPFPNGGDLQKSFPPEQNISNSYSFENKEYKTIQTTGAGIYLRHTWGNLVPALFKKPQPNHTAYAHTFVYSPEKQAVGLWVNFQNYSRSEKDLPPPTNQWDYKGSRLWINDNEILPPQWHSNHSKKSNETPLTNENFEVRPPLMIILNKGWNKVLLKLPIGNFSTSEVRLVKWHFNFVFVSLDGKEEIKNIIYSPEKKR